MHKLTYKGISLLYLPLAASWVLMLLEGPLINVFLARGGDPELDLAAFGVALSIILVVEAPILMMLELSIALARNVAAFRRIRQFYLMVGLFITAIGLILFYTPLCRVLLCGVMNVPPAIAGPTAVALRILTWWPLPIGWRRIHQGVLINDGRTRVISLATAVRLAIILTMMLVGMSLARASGATVAALSMVVAVVVETSITHWAARSSIESRLVIRAKEADAPCLRYLWLFYLPLAITTVLRQSIRPVVTAGMAVAPMAEVSLAAWPIAFSLSSIFWGPTMGLQQVTIALSRDGDAWRTVSRFALFTGLVLTACLGIIAFTPLLDTVLLQVFGLSPHLAQFAAPSARIMALLPLAYTFLALFTGLLVKRERTATVRTAKLFNLLVVGLSLFIGTRLGHLSGAVLGSLAVTQGALLEAVWLYWRSRPAVREVAGSRSETAS